MLVLLDESDCADAGIFVSALERSLAGLVVTEAVGDFFVFYDPDGVTRPEARFPFCTVVTGDRYDAASDLDRELGAYRVNVGISRETYESQFGTAPRQPVGQDVIDTGYDYAARDTLLPHPFYAPMHWLCVVNPGAKTLADVGRYMAEAHTLARRTYDNQQKRRRSG